MHWRDVILQTVWKMRTWVTAESFPGSGRVGCWLKSPFSPSCFQPTAHSPSAWKAFRSNLHPHSSNCMQNDVRAVHRSLLSFREKKQYYTTHILFSLSLSRKQKHTYTHFLSNSWFAFCPFTCKKREIYGFDQGKVWLSITAGRYRHQHQDPTNNGTLLTLEGY